MYISFNIILKTNECHIFISSNFLIKNLIFYGNDIFIQDLNDINACYNTNLKFCCNESDFKIYDPSNSINQCVLFNKNINQALNSNRYGLFNIEYIFDQNQIFPNLTIINCEFLNIFLINIEKGFSSLISLAPFSGILNIIRCLFNNNHYSKGLIYYSS